MHLFFQKEIKDGYISRKSKNHRSRYKSELNEIKRVRNKSKGEKRALCNVRTRNSFLLIIFQRYLKLNIKEFMEKELNY